MTGTSYRRTRRCKICRSWAQPALTPPVRPRGAQRTTCRIDGANGSVLEILFGQRASRDDVSRIDYTLVLKTTARDYAVDGAAFRLWLTSVKIGPA